MRPRSASRPSAKSATYNRCLTVWTDHITGHGSTLALGLPGRRDIIEGKFKITSAKDISVDFQYVYEKDKSSRVGQFEGQLETLPISNVNDPDLLPGLKLAGKWWEKISGADEWSFTGTKFFELSEGDMNKGYTTLAGEWAQNKADSSGIWAIDFPKLSLERLKDACFAGK